MKRRFLSDVRALAARALAAPGGKRVSASVVEWDMAGDCANSFRTEVFARPSRRKDGFRDIVVKPMEQIPIEVVLLTRCRLCRYCKEAKRKMWAYRAEAETRASYRTWFGTLTLSPDQHFRILTECRARESKQGVDFDSLSSEEQFKLLDSRISRELKLMLMRVRSAYGSPYRYLVIAEAHKSGLPHYHVLMHEVTANAPLRYNTLNGQWRLGFSKWRLVKSVNEARYVCKYLTKSTQARVRASQEYGQKTSLDIEVENFVEDMTP